MTLCHNSHWNMKSLCHDHSGIKLSILVVQVPSCSHTGGSQGPWALQAHGGREASLNHRALPVCCCSPSVLLC